MANPFMTRLLGNESESAPEGFSLPSVDDEVELEDKKSPQLKKKQKGQTKDKGKGLLARKTTVNLTPEAYRDVIRARELKRLWIMGNAGLFAVAVLIVSFIFVASLPGRTALDGELAINTELEAALSQYQEVNLAMEQMGTIENKLNSAANNEINWSMLIGSIENTLPSGTSVSSIGIATDSASPDRAASILVKFVADSPLGYADTLRAVQSAAGVSNVQIGGMSSSGASYQFSATFDYDSSIRTNRFPAAATTGGN